jgi:hypothetical protein
MLPSASRHGKGQAAWFIAIALLFIPQTTAVQGATIGVIE